MGTGWPGMGAGWRTILTVGVVDGRQVSGRSSQGGWIWPNVWRTYPPHIRHVVHLVGARLIPNACPHVRHVVHLTRAGAVLRLQSGPSFGKLLSVRFREVTLCVAKQRLEDSPSGLWRTPGTRVGFTPSGVQIPHPPPSNPASSAQMMRGFCVPWDRYVFSAYISPKGRPSVERPYAGRPLSSEPASRRGDPGTHPPVFTSRTNRVHS